VPRGYITQFQGHTPTPHRAAQSPSKSTHKKNNGAIWLLELAWRFAQQPHINEKERVRKKKISMENRIAEKNRHSHNPHGPFFLPNKLKDITFSKTRILRQQICRIGSRSVHKARCW
jgi:hypothetical protein